MRSGNDRNPAAEAPNLSVHQIPAGAEGSSIRLDASLAGGTYDGRPVYRWSVDGGRLDDATAAEPIWTRPIVNADEYVAIRLTVTVRGEGITARAGSSDSVSSRGVVALVRDIGGNSPTLALSINAPPSGRERSTITLSAELIGASSSAELAYDWRVALGSLDDRHSATPRWTLPRVVSNIDIALWLTVTVDGVAVSARRYIRIRDDNGDHGDSRETASVIDVPGGVWGQIDSASDRDMFHFSLGDGSPTGEILLRTTDSTDTVGTLFDGTGIELAHNDDGNDPNAGFYIQTTLGAGDYYLEVKGADPSVRGRYTLSIAPPPTNRPPTVDGARFPDVVNLTTGGVSWAVYDPQSAFRDQDGDAVWIQAVSSNTSVTRLERQAASIMVHPVGAGRTSVTIIGHDPSGLTARHFFDVTVSEPVRSDPTASFDSLGNTLTLSFNDTYSAGEQRAYQAAARQVSPRGSWKVHCFTSSSDTGGVESVSLDLPLGTFAEPGVEFEAVYRYAGGGRDCNEQNAGDAIFSRRATATVPGSRSFNIEVVLIGNPSNAIRQSINEAKRKWENIIRSSVNDVDFSLLPLRPGFCLPNSPRIDDVVDDVRVFVEVTYIDGVGATAAQAGVCNVRVPSGLPILSVIRLDNADFADLSHALRVEIIGHELTHALGFTNSGWQRANLLRDPSLGGFKSDFSTDTPDTHFVGSNAIRAFNQLGGQSYAGAKVPVENSLGGPANRDSHWRESVFRSELMTPVISAGRNPLSSVTIGSMQDIGYSVNLNAGEQYQLPPAAPLAIAPRQTADDTFSMRDHAEWEKLLDTPPAAHDEGNLVPSGNVQQPIRARLGQ